MILSTIASILLFAKDPLRMNIRVARFKEIERYLKQLKDENKIEFQGSLKTGGYIIV